VDFEKLSHLLSIYNAQSTAISRLIKCYTVLLNRLGYFQSIKNKKKSIVIGIIACDSTASVRIRHSSLGQSNEQLSS